MFGEHLTQGHVALVSFRRRVSCVSFSSLVRSCADLNYDGLVSCGLPHRRERKYSLDNENKKRFTPITRP